METGEWAQLPRDSAKSGEAIVEQSRVDFLLAYLQGHLVSALQITKETNHIAEILVWDATIFQPSSNFWRFIVLVPTTVRWEVGKEADHQVRASAKSDFRSFT
jgi:hypothetical protein